jgi:hypothetical protein
MSTRPSRVETLLRLVPRDGDVVFSTAVKGRPDWQLAQRLRAIST